MAFIFFSPPTVSASTEQVLASIEVGTADKIRGIIVTSQDGQLSFRESLDGGQTYDYIRADIALTGGTAKEFEFEPYGPRVQLVLENGAGGAATVKCQARLVSAGPR